MKEICVSLTRPQWDSKLNRADLVELRVDLLGIEASKALMKEATCPLILTDRQNRAELLATLAKWQPRYLDVEFGIEAPPGVDVIRSFHDYQGIPDDLDQLYSAMRQQGGALYKIAVTPRTTAEAFDLLGWADDKPDLICIGMGEVGVPTRILAKRLTFASLQSGQEAAPGQVPIDELIDYYRYYSISDTTEITGLIGDPVAQSTGKYVHNAVFKKYDIDAVYLPLLVRKGEVSNFFKSVIHHPVKGFSVTMPLKEEVLPEMGAINTLRYADGRWEGTNTDGAGALDALGSVAGQTVVVIGAGGAAKAIVAEAKQRGAQVVVLNRTVEKGQAICDQAGALSELPNIDYDVLIQATSVGMVPNTDQTVVDRRGLKKGTTVMDIVAHPPVTRLLQEAKAAGCTTIGGREMYIHQAARQQQFWYGIENSEEIIREQVTRLSHK